MTHKYLPINYLGQSRVIVRPAPPPPHPANTLVLTLKDEGTRREEGNFTFDMKILIAFEKEVCNTSSKLLPVSKILQIRHKILASFHNIFSKGTTKKQSLSVVCAVILNRWMKTAEKKSATNKKHSACWYFQSTKAVNGKSLVIISGKLTTTKYN